MKNNSIYALINIFMLGVTGCVPGGNGGNNNSNYTPSEEVGEHILVIGDSWSRQWPKYANIPESHQQAKAGSAAKSWVENKEDRLGKAIDTPARAVIMTLGGNDFEHQKIRSQEEFNQKIPEVVNNMSSVMNAMRIKGVAVYIINYCDPSQGADPKSAAFINSLREVIFYVAEKNGVVVLDSAKWLGPEHFTLSADRVHPNALGAKKIAEEVLKIVN